MLTELPKYFVIKRPFDSRINKDWKSFLYYMKRLTNKEWGGDSYLFYGIDGNTKYNGSDKETNRFVAKTARKWIWWSYPFMILFWSLYIFTPDKKDSMLIIAGGQTLNWLTTDSSAKQIPKELTTFVVQGLKSMAEDVKVDLNIANAKDKVMDEVKNMTGQQVTERMASDSNFAKIILGK